ncbi:ncs1 nucleoside transporter family protein [Moniliophthora roreri MCA 2997]|nr:ncs1 nucleoside transporter family protein [Moniliophthora roreri MCA 2997]
MSNPQNSTSNSTFRRLLRRIEVPIDPDATYKNDHWTNRDLIPMPKERRTYAIWSYCIYWCISGMCISAYTTGSTLLAFGLTPQQAIGALIVGAFCTGLLSVACGWMGERHHIGFTVSSRHTWGMRGAYFPIIIQTFVTIFWDGLQAYWGGQATTVTLGAIFTSLAHMKSTLAGGVLMTKDLIGMVIYYVFFIAIMQVPPEKLQKPFIVSSILFAGTLIGLLAWAVSTVDGGGPMWNEPGNPSHGSIGWSMMFGITSVLGAWGGGTLGQSDWTRYANRPFAPTLSQMFFAPMTITVTCIVGIVVTSCAKQILGGQIIWQPFVLMARIQDFYGDSPRARAAVFFAGLGCTCAQLGVSIVLNSVSAGMDMAGLNPKYLNIRRGAFILAAAGILSNPWQYLSNATTFLTVISGFGIFTAPFTGVMLADYHIVRRYVIKMKDLYIGDKRSLYWYWHGFHWRALAAWVMGVFPTMPGMIMTVTDPTTYNAWVKLFNITFFVGLSISFVTYYVICWISPPPGLGIGETRHDDSMIFGEKDSVASRGSESPDHKEQDGLETKVPDLSSV